MQKLCETLVDELGAELKTADDYCSWLVVDDIELRVNRHKDSIHVHSFIDAKLRCKFNVYTIMELTRGMPRITIKESRGIPTIVDQIKKRCIGPALPFVGKVKAALAEKNSKRNSIEKIATDLQLRYPQMNISIEDSCFKFNYVHLGVYVSGHYFSDFVIDSLSGVDSESFNRIMDIMIKSNRVET